MITAPYNFVPLNEKVFCPPWADNVSHDIPFEDGESGSIDITIIAKSPIYIRNHYQKDDKYYTDQKNNKISKEFCSFFKDGKRECYIPGSSIKGMIRNIMEIMSFAKIKIDKETHKKSLSVRDMTNKKLVATAQKCGFLTINSDGSGTIEDCGKVKTISYYDIKDFSNQNLYNIESVVEKYKKITNLSIPFKNIKKFMKVKGKDIPKTIAKFDKSSNNIGTLVFTSKIDNKKNEFVFKPNGQTFDISKKIVDNFKKVYFDDENSEIGQYWKGRKKIPVFYTTDKQGNIQAIGLTQIFKLAYNKTILEAAKQTAEANALDLPETIFGTVDKKRDFTLKGRVQFSHLKASVVRYEKPKEEVLGSPNPTYYPNYIEQNGANGKVTQYTTLMDSNAKIKGYKQYPLQPHISSNQASNDNEKISTQFKPLNSGITFGGKIRFHNLKKVEIGALLSALTFHGQEDRYYHNIGMAKPLGYGKIKVDIKLNDLKFSKQEYLKEFEKLMNNWDKKAYQNWLSSPQLKELFAIHSKYNNKVLRYQMLENPNPRYSKRNGKDEVNDFVGAKKEKEYLLHFSQQIQSRAR